MKTVCGLHSFQQFFPDPCVLVVGQKEKPGNFINIGEGTVPGYFLEPVQEVILTFELSTVDIPQSIPGVELILLRFEVLLKGFEYTIRVVFVSSFFPMKILIHLINIVT